MNEYLLRIAAYVECEVVGRQCNFIKHLKMIIVKALIKVKELRNTNW